METSADIQKGVDMSSQTKPVMQTFPKSSASKKTLNMFLVAFVVVLLGVGTGWVLSGGKSSNNSTVQRSTENEVKVSDTEAGLADESTFPDSVEGVLAEEGVNGEGTHHLERQGGPSQNVYLTSTVIDLQSFVGKKVKVWGETLSGKKAGWLMDVGRIKVVE